MHANPVAPAELQQHQERTSAPRRYTIAVIPGDGIGQEVTPAALSVLETACRRHGAAIDARMLPWSAERYRDSGVMIPEGGIESLRSCDAILFGAHGAPGVPDSVAGWDLLFALRKAFDQYVNLRPIRLLPGVDSRLQLAPGETIDLAIVRENIEGEFAGPGGESGVGTPLELSTQLTIISRYGTERIARFAFGLARRRRRKLTSITKSNAMPDALGLWDRVIAEVAAEFPDVEYDRLYVDAAAAEFVRRPQRLDVVLATTLFGDILSDLGAAITGGLGLAPSANLNPERRHPSLFEPIHGSAPDIAGQGIANPIGAILAGAMMLDHLGEAEAAADVRAAVETVLDADAIRTPDLGGTASTAQFAAAVDAALAGLPA